MLSKLKPFVPVVLLTFLGPLFMAVFNAAIGYRITASSWAMVMHDAVSLGYGAAVMLSLQHAYRHLPRLRKLFGHN